MIPTFEDLVKGFDACEDDEVGVFFADLCLVLPFEKDMMRKAVERGIQDGKLWAPFGFADDQSFIVIRDRIKLYLDYAKSHPEWLSIINYLEDLEYQKMAAPSYYIYILCLLVERKYLQANDKLQLRLNPLMNW